MTVFEIDLEKVKKNYEELKKELPNAIIAYAIKANYDKKILKTLAGIGCVAEVCSEYENGIARRAGFKKIIRNGFAPTGKAWLTNIEAIEDRKRIKGLIGARLRLDAKSKLGIDEKEIIKHKWNCISIHTREGFSEALKKATELAGKTGAEYIDAGGSLNEDRIKELRKIEKLIIEPGRHIVGNACRIISKVLLVKEDKVIIDAGMNILNKFSDNKYRVHAEKEGTNSHAYKIYGPIPTDIDGIGTYNLPALTKGDKIIIENAGAYTLSMAANWTHRIPKIKYLQKT